MTLSISIKHVSPHTLVANYKEYFDLNAGAVILPEYILVIDTLYYPTQAKEFNKHLEEKFELPVKYLFITHYHGDHHFGMSAFNNTIIIGSNELIKNMKKRKETNWTREAFDGWKKSEPELAAIIDEVEIRLPDIGFDDEYSLDGVKLIESGGHSSCSSMAYFEEEKVLFTGDEVASGWWIFMSDPTGSPDKCINSFERILELDIDYIVPGHGPLAEKQYLQDQLDFMRKLRNATLTAISEGKNPEEIKIPNYLEPAVDWQIPEALKFLYSFYSTKH